MSKCEHYERDETKSYPTDDCISCKYAVGISSGDGSVNIKCTYDKSNEKKE